MVTILLRSVEFEMGGNNLKVKLIWEAVNMKNVKLFSMGLAVLASLSLTSLSADASQTSNGQMSSSTSTTSQMSNSTQNGSVVKLGHKANAKKGRVHQLLQDRQVIDDLGWQLYQKNYGNNFSKQALTMFKTKDGRYAVGQGTADSTLYYQINNDDQTMTVWRPDTSSSSVTATQKFTKTVVPLSSLGFNPANGNFSASNNNSSTQSSVASSSSSNNGQQASTSSHTQQLLQDRQVIDDLGWQLYQKYYGNDFSKQALTMFKASDGRYAVGQGTADSTIYYQINSDGKTMTVWHRGANQQYVKSVIPLSSLGFNPDQQTATSNVGNHQANANASSSSNNGTSGLAGDVNHGTAPAQVVAQQAATRINIPSAHGQQNLSYYQVAALIYAKCFGIDRIGANQHLQLNMNKDHSLFILGEGTADSTLYFRVNRDQKTVTVWAPLGNNNALVKNTYQLSSLVNEFDATSAQQQLVNATAKALKK